MSAVESDIIALLDVRPRSCADLARICEVKPETVRHVICGIRKTGRRILFADGHYYFPKEGQPVDATLSSTQAQVLQDLKAGAFVSNRRVVYQLRQLGFHVVSTRGGGYRLS